MRVVRVCVRVANCRPARVSVGVSIMHIVLTRINARSRVRMHARVHACSSPRAGIQLARFRRGLTRRPCAHFKRVAQVMHVLNVRMRHDNGRLSWGALALD